jgi:hypothetical protein
MAACRDTGRALASLQLGVGVPRGSQSVDHALRSGLSCCPEDVTLQLDFRNAFASVSRTALLQAVASRAPRLLPFAAWTYWSHGLLVIQGAPAAHCSQSGVRKGDPFGPLLFALDLQGAPRKGAGCVSGHSRCGVRGRYALVGPPGSSHRGLPAAGHCDRPDWPHPLPPQVHRALPVSSHRHGRCIRPGYGPSPRGIVAAGTPLGSDAFVEADARSQAETVAGPVTALASLPLGRQDKFLLLRSCLQARLTHLTRITPWSRLSSHVAVAERRVLVVALNLVWHPPPAEMQSGLVVAQLALSLRTSGLGLRLTTSLEAAAAFLTAASAADVAMRPAPPPFRPFNPASPHCIALIARWVALHDAAPGLWSPKLRALAAPLLAPVLVRAQQYGRHLADQRFADLLASAPSSFEGTRFRARFHSCVCRPAYI